MALQLKVINRKTLQELNTKLGQLQTLYDEICKAQSAGVPEMDGLKQACADLSNQIKKFKASYFSTEI